MMMKMLGELYLGQKKFNQAISEIDLLGQGQRDAIRIYDCS